MTQSGVSQHIKKLEGFLGASLLDRDANGFELTEAGRRLYQQAQPIVDSLAHLQEQVMADPPHQGRVNVISPGSVGLQLYRHLLGFQQQHQGLIIDHRFAPNGSIESAVVQKHADIGLMTQIPQHPQCAFNDVGREQLLLVTPASESVPSLSALEKLGFIDHPDGHHHANLLLSANFSDFSSSQQIPVRGFSNQIGLILEPVSLGLGFTVLPQHAVASFAKPESIRVHTLSTPVYEPLYLVTSATTQRPARVQVLLEEIRAWLKSG